MQEEMLNEELKEELDEEQEELKSEDDVDSEEEEKEEIPTNPVKLELLEYRSKEDIVKEIDSFTIDESLTLEEKINKCRFQEELKPLIKDINFEEKILISSFDGNEEEMMYWMTLSGLVNSKLWDKKSEKLLPLKKEYIKSKIAEDKNKVDAENRKRKEAAKQNKQNKKDKSKESKENAESKKYKYPFKLHFAGHNIETDHIFENDKEYKPEEITKKMLEHQYYEFAGSVQYTYIEKDNVLIPIFQQYKKG